jgi:hypothetical protein
MSFVELDVDRAQQRERAVIKKVTLFLHSPWYGLSLPQGFSSRSYTSCKRLENTAAGSARRFSYSEDDTVKPYTKPAAL